MGYGRDNFNNYESAWHNYPEAEKLDLKDEDGAPMAIGTIHGYRAWDVDSHGRLRPSTYSSGGIWTNGINEAVCKCDYRSKKVAALNHACGFYAWFAGDNSYAKSSDITGVIEAWGTVTIGDYGFRAQYAKVVAMVRPSALAKQPLCQHALWMKRKGLQGFSFIMGVLTIIGCLALGSVFLPQWWAITLMVLGVLVGAFHIIQAFHGDECTYNKASSMKWERLKANYPDVKWYRSHSRMLKDFPFDNVDNTVSPDTFEDFWSSETPRKRKIK